MFTRQMMNRMILALAAVAFVAVGSVLAGENATLVLRSGERVSGSLEDMGGTDITISVNGSERRVPLSDIAVIDFVGGGQGLPETETSKAREGTNVIILKGGQSYEGRLYDISGTTPLKITFSTGGSNRDFSSNEIGRIYMAPVPGSAVATTGTIGAGTPVAPAAPTPAAVEPPAGAIVVSPKTAWTPTNITVRQGDVVNFNTSGEVMFAPNEAAGSAGAHNGQKTPGAPIPGALAGALIGRVGNSAPFAIGNQTSVPMPASGQLYLGVNDDILSDNSGQFYVAINVTPAPRRR